MARRKLKRIEKIILIGFINSLLVFLAIWIWYKAPDRQFYVPKGYQGWVKIEYRVPGAPPLPEQDGKQILTINDSGYLATSTPLEIGWRRDDFFWKNDQEEIPRFVETGDPEPSRYIHALQPLSMFYENVLKVLAPGSDTTLPDKTKIKKNLRGQVDYQPGKKRLEYFYMSETPQPFSFTPPPLEDPAALQSLDSRLISN